uniref:Uncharacterized protein n=1 Tax=Glossina morsitans morsitans TaxID=37546 RepID=A0ABK9NFX1_GLOMM
MISSLLIVFLNVHDFYSYSFKCHAVYQVLYVFIKSTTVH